MSQWSRGILTNAGRALQLKAETGTPIKITKIVIGSGATDADPKTLTALIRQEASMDITTNDVVADVVRIRGSLSNQSISTQFYVRELGVIAENAGQDVLYLYASDSIPDPITPYNGSSPVIREFAIDITLGSANLNVTNNPSAYITSAMLDDVKSSIDNTNKNLESLQKYFDTFKLALLKDIYYVGKILIDDNPKNPAQRSDIGFGTWVQIKDRFIMAAGDVYKLNTTGGAKEAQLSVANIPAHNHNLTIYPNGQHHHGTWGEHYNASDWNSLWGLYDGNANHIGSEGGEDYDNYLFNTSTDGCHVHGGYISYTGGNIPFSILNPYIVKYVWERTA